MRTAGMTYTALPDGRISNLYNLKLVNKTHKDIDFILKLENLPGEISLVGSGRLTIKKEDYANLQFFVKLNKADVTNWKTAVKIEIYENNPQVAVHKKIKTITAKFIGPEVYN
jgi:polyferredoxin